LNVGLNRFAPCMAPCRESRCWALTHHCPRGLWLSRPGVWWPPGPMQRAAAHWCQYPRSHDFQDENTTAGTGRLFCPAPQPQFFMCGVSCARACPPPSLHKQISIPPFQVMRSYTTLTSRCIYPCIMYIASSCGTCTVISFCAYCSIYDEVNTKGAEANARAPSALRSKIL
jgi:hypothetical protein